MSRNRPAWLGMVLLGLGGFELAAQQEPSAATLGPPPLPLVDPVEPIDPAGIRGALLLVGGGDVPDEVWRRFRELAPGDDPRLVVVRAAGRDAELVPTDQQRSRWMRRGFSRVELFDAATGEEANGPRGAELLAAASAVWIHGGGPSRAARRYLGTDTERHLRGVLDRGGVIGGTSGGAAVMSRVMVTGNGEPPRLARGFDWLPDAIVEPHFTERQRSGRLLAALEEHPARWGVGIDEQTALLARGRQLEVLGAAGVTLCLAGGHGQPVLERWEAGATGDLTAWRRAARQQLLPTFPPPEPDPPSLAAGALVIAGGGRLPREILDRFLQLAGGPDARIVFLPTAMPDPLPPDEQLIGDLARAGARNVKVLGQRERDAVDADWFVDEIRAARGVWFGGGRQWRFVDAYEGTRPHDAMRDVLARRGVIGGSSAGASILAEYLVRGNPLGNSDMMARGYERGLGFLPGTAIDQHFSQRNRHRDLASVIQRYPQLLGIGVDEQSALVVQGNVGEVVGRGAVHFFSSSEPEATSVAAGGQYDLRTRRRESAPPGEASPPP